MSSRFAFERMAGSSKLIVLRCSGDEVREVREIIDDNSRTFAIKN
jgi:hypothetical protein